MSTLWTPKQSILTPLRCPSLTRTHSYGNLPYNIITNHCEKLDALIGRLGLSYIHWCKWFHNPQLLCMKISWLLTQLCLDEKRRAYILILIVRVYFVWWLTKPCKETFSSNETELDAEEWTGFCSLNPHHSMAPTIDIETLSSWKENPNLWEKLFSCFSHVHCTQGNCNV